MRRLLLVFLPTGVCNMHGVLHSNFSLTLVFFFPCTPLVRRLFPYWVFSRTHEGRLLLARPQFFCLFVCKMPKVHCGNLEEDVLLNVSVLSRA